MTYYDEGSIRHWNKPMTPDPAVLRSYEQQQENIRLAEYEQQNGSFRERIRTMGVALWCDPGDHPFKGGVPGSQSYVGTEVNDDGKEVQVTMNVCPEHTFRSLQEDTNKALTSSE